MQLKNGCMAVKLLDFIGLCGEVPVSLVRMLPGYYDYNRRVVTALIREGYLKEQGYRRRIVRSLSLTELGSKQLQWVSPGRAQRVHSHALAPENGHGSWKKTLRLHRGAACLLTAMRLRAIWQSGSPKESVMGKQLVYFSAYELTQKYSWDNKGARLSGIFVYRYYYYPVYYLGDSNLLWSEEAERMFLDRVASSPLGYGRTYGSSILLGDKWDLIENLMAHGVNPRSRLIRFSKNSSFHYFTVDEMGLRLMKLVLDEMALYRFQRYLQQNGICKASMLPLYLFSLELLSEAYALKKGKQMRAELDRGALFSCQADVVKRICNTGPNLITIPDKWLLDLDTERDDSSDELLLSPNATFLSQQSGM